MLGKLLDGADHPLMFVIFLGMALLGVYGVGTWAFKSLGWTGPAALVQHP